MVRPKGRWRDRWRFKLIIQRKREICESHEQQETIVGQKGEQWNKGTHYRYRRK